MRADVHPRHLVLQPLGRELVTALQGVPVLLIQGSFMNPLPAPQPLKRLVRMIGPLLAGSDLPRHSVSHGGGIPYDIIRTSLRPLVR